MGRMKELYMEMQETAGERQLAKVLGISYEDLTQLDYDIETDASTDDFIYNYRVEFDVENSPQHILSKIKRLENDCRVYLQVWELDEEYDYDEQFDAITENKNYFQKFKDEISSLQSLCNLKGIDDKLKGILNRQIFISVIGTMETFLSDAFINLTFDNEQYFKNLVATHPEFKQRKFELKEIFEEYDKLKETAKKILLDIIYHNLPTIKQMYSDTFEIEFPQIKDVYKSVLKRHDLVHRNGKTKDGVIVETDENAIKELIKTVTDFVNEIAEKLAIE